MPDATSSAATAITERTLGAYLDTIGSATPTPGGGSAAGVIGALGASLGLMVISLTRSDDPAASAALAEAGTTLVRLRDRFTALAEEDETAYGAYRDASALPKDTIEEKTARREAMQQALKRAATVPLETCEASAELARTLDPVRAHGNPHVLSDVRIAAICSRACFDASRINIDVNLAMIKDEGWVADVRQQLDAFADEPWRLTADTTG